MTMSESSVDTLVELYDPQTHIYNALGVMLLRPRRVVFLIPEHASVVYNRFKNAYSRLWEGHRCLPESVLCVLTGTSDIMELAAVISQFAGDGAVLDIEGGTPELYLAAGYVYGRAPDSFRCVRIDFGDMKIKEYSSAGDVTETVERPFTEQERESISLTVEEIVRIYGGHIYRSSVRELCSRGMTREQIDDDVSRVWRVMLLHSRHTWNAVVPDRIHAKDDGSCDIYVNGSDESINSVGVLIRDLVSAGLITPRGQNGQRRFYRCKSPAVFSCLRKAGELLELYMNSLAASIPGVSDAISGVSIGYEGEDGSADNEIDCIFTRGATPVFISCKNGRVGSDELYKFAAVCSQFGGNEKIQILVAPGLSGSAGMSQSHIKSVCERAELYGIRLITDICDISRKEASSELRAVIERK